MTVEERLSGLLEKLLEESRGGRLQDAGPELASKWGFKTTHGQHFSRRIGFSWSQLPGGSGLVSTILTALFCFQPMTVVKMLHQETMLSFSTFEGFLAALPDGGASDAEADARSLPTDAIISSQACTI